MTSSSSLLAHVEVVRFLVADGYLVMRGFFSEQQRTALVEAVDAVEQWPERAGHWMHYYEPSLGTGRKLLCRTENFVPYHEPLRALLCEGALSRAVARLLGDDYATKPPYLLKDKINYKAPGASGFAAHQDAPAYSEQGQRRHLTALVAVDPATVANGCLEVARDSKWVWKLGHSLPHRTDLGGALDPVIERELDWKSVPLEVGDVLFFGSHLPHRSGPNTTSRSRRAIYVTYNAFDEGDCHDRYYQDKRRKFPPDNERDPSKDYSDGARVYNLANPIRHFGPDGQVLSGPADAASGADK